MCIRMKHLVVMLLFILIAVPWNASVAVPDPQLQDQGDGRTVTYRFTARIKSNGGVVRFQPGEMIDGTFTYDLEAKPRSATRPRHILDSPRNTLAFQTGGFRFSGAGKIWVTIGNFEHAEHFGIGAPDLQLPQGWEMEHGGKSQTYSVLFQNAPAQGVIDPTGIPERLYLPSFVNTRELRLDFFHGVQFPGGKVDRRATVFATVESLELVQNVRRR